MRRQQPGPGRSTSEGPGPPETTRRTGAPRRRRPSSVVRGSTAQREPWPGFAAPRGSCCCARAQAASGADSRRRWRRCVHSSRAHGKMRLRIREAGTSPDRQHSTTDVGVAASRSSDEHRSRRAGRERSDRHGAGNGHEESHVRHTRRSVERFPGSESGTSTIGSRGSRRDDPGACARGGGGRPGTPRSPTSPTTRAA